LDAHQRRLDVRSIKSKNDNVLTMGGGQDEVALYSEQRRTPGLSQGLKRQCFGSVDGAVSIPPACATGELRLDLVLFGVLSVLRLACDAVQVFCLPPRKTKAC